MWVGHDSSRQLPHRPTKSNSFVYEENRRIKEEKEKEGCHGKYLMEEY